jgi:hypothetical protein
LVVVEAISSTNRWDYQKSCVRGVMISFSAGGMTVSANNRPGKHVRLADPCSLVRSKHLFLRPDLPFLRQSRASRVKSAAQRRDRSHAQPPLGGEHGEDPRFDAAEHDARLRPRRGLPIGSRRVPRHPAGLKRSAYRIANWFIASFQLCAACPQSAVMLRKASQISLLAASSVGK